MNAPADRKDRRIDAAAMKALAHPLRVDLLDRLIMFGPSTATALAEQLGESSGATSYHLRQLARHGLIEEDPDRGTARERWWRVVPGGMTMDPSEYEEGTAEFEAGTLVARQMLDQRFRHADAFLRRGARELGREWFGSAALMSARAVLTAEELAATNEEISAVIEAALERYRGRGTVEGARTVVLHYQAFPVMGAPVPEGQS